jgi:hypothetical protein
MNSFIVISTEDEVVKAQLSRYIGTQIANKKFSPHRHLDFLDPAMVFGLELLLGPEPLLSLTSGS